MSMPPLDCTACGACCVNPASNRNEDFHDWVEVQADDAILTRKDLVKKYITFNQNTVPHLRLDSSGRCLALLGKLGHTSRCRVYGFRPDSCRRVQLGDEECLKLRRQMFGSKLQT